ncbi:hypothetical protein Aph02nite_70340 [Actinoplanes philippinensis]|nr:hypothetical protein Aph02nite_70340 [Actinoplanes philippinensis]
MFWEPPGRRASERDLNFGARPAVLTENLRTSDHGLAVRLSAEILGQIGANREIPVDNTAKA